MRRNLMLFALPLLLLLQHACSGSLPPDADGAYTKAANLFEGVSVPDTLNPRKGDKADWRKFRYMKRTEVTILVVMAPLETNTVRGRVAIFDSTFAQVQEAPVRPGQGRYELRFLAKADQDYYVVVEATDGAGPYQIRLSGKPADPCARCGPSEICRGGRCLPRPRPVVKKPCGGCEDGYACDEAINECVWPACVGVRCRAHRVCNKRGRCVRTTPGLRCPRGQRARRGKCVPIKCPAGKVLKGSRCVDEPKVEDGDFATVRAKVVGVVPLSDTKSQIIIDKGSLHGITKGQTGHMGGVSKSTVRITKVHAARAVGTINVAASEIEGKGKTVILKVKK